MSSREQHHRPHLFSLSLFLFPPPIFEESLIPRSFSLPTFFRHRWKDETVRCSILYVRLIIRILSLSLSREYGEIVAQIGSLCYVRGARVTISRISIRNTF